MGRRGGVWRERNEKLPVTGCPDTSMFDSEAPSSQLTEPTRGLVWSLVLRDFGHADHSDELARFVNDEYSPSSVFINRAAAFTGSSGRTV